MSYGEEIVLCIINVLICAAVSFVFYLLAKNKQDKHNEVLCKLRERMSKKQRGRSHRIGSEERIGCEQA